MKKTDKYEKLTKAKRTRTIIRKLFQYNFGEFVSGLQLPGGRFYSLGTRKKKRKTKSIQIANRLRLMFEDLGPTFMKLGQAMSLRPDLFPEDVITELQKLQNSAVPVPYDEIKPLVESELGKPINQMFTSFSQEPIASASIAQVHKATTLFGDTLAVKVQRPRIEKLVQIDLDILIDLAKTAETYINSLKIYKPLEIVEQFRRTMLLELDFNYELRTMAHFKQNYGDNQDIIIPGVYRRLSTKRVLSMEYVHGYILSELFDNDIPGIDKKKIAKLGVDFVLKQIFKYGIFNADPHPGNFIVRENSVLVPLDYGMVGFLEPEMKGFFAHMLSAFVNRDAQRLVRIFMDIGFVDDNVNLRQFKQDINNLVHYYYSIPVSQLNVTQILMDLNYIIRTHHIDLPSDFALMLKVLVTLEAFARRLDPEFDIISVAKPFIDRLLMSQFDPRKHTEDMLDFVRNSGNLALNLPNDLSTIMNNLKSGNMKAKIEPVGMEKFTTELDRSINRLSFSIIIAGILIGSSFMMQMENCPTLFGVPILALGGYLVAGIFGLWLIFGIIRSGRL
ncbi:MAG: ABC1 kinase family protein [Spirochaetia bacterium]